MASLTIDLGKYEYQSDSANNDQEIYHGTDTMDFQHIDAEIIDDGISEDELEIISASIKTPVSYTKSYSPVEDLVNSPTLTNSCENKGPCEKVNTNVKKYPWYCTNYKTKIQENKYVDAVKHAKKILMGYKNKTSAPITVGVINLDDSSNSSDTADKITRRDNPVSLVRQKGTAIEKVPIVDKKYRSRKKNSYTEMIRMQQIINKRQRRSVMIDIKKNQGLIGMKVQKLPENEINKEIFTKKKKMRRKRKENIGIKEDANLDYHVDTYNKTQIKLGSSLNKNEKSKNTHTKHKKLNIDRPKLKCSLRINSPQILLKIKKMTNFEENESDQILSPDVILNPKTNEKDTANFKTENPLSQIYNGGNQSSHTVNCNKTVKYKPMPKSKRLALEKNLEIDSEHRTQKNMENQQNKSAEYLQLTSPNTICPTESHIKDRCDENISSSNVKHKNRDVINKAYPTNKFTQKVLKLAKSNPGIIDKISKGRRKKKLENIYLEKNKDLIQSSSPKTEESPATSLATTETNNNIKIIAHNTNSTNKDEALLKYTKPIMAHEPVAVTISNARNVDTSINIGMNFVSRNDSLVGKNSVNFNVPTRLKPNQNITVNNTSPALLPVASKKPSQHSNDSNSIIFLRKQGEIDITSIKPTSEESSMQNSMSFTNPPIEEGTMATKQAHENKESEHNLCRDYLLTISPSHRVSDPEYIISDVNINLTQEQKYDSVLPSKHQSVKEANTKTFTQVSEQSNLDLQAPKIEPREDNNLLQYPDEYILGNVTTNENISSMAVNKINVILNSQSLHMAPGQPNHNTRPYIGTTFQRPALTPARPENTLPRKPIPYKVRPQNILRQVRHWRYNQRNIQNFLYPPGMTNVHRMPWNNMNQHMGTNYGPNNYSQPPVYNSVHYQNMPRMPPQTCGVNPNNEFQNMSYVPPQACEVKSNNDSQNMPRMPPGICNVKPNNDYQNIPYMPPQTCDVQPNNDYKNMPRMPGKCNMQPSSVHFQYNIRLPPFPPPQLRPPAPPSHQINNNNFKDSSVIGKNVTGLVKKINIISNPPYSKINGKVDKKQITRQKEIKMKNELNKSIMPVVRPVESAVKSELKRSNSTESDRKQNLSVGKPGPLSKKVKGTTSNLQTQKIGYSPPILPIQSFQNALSELQIGVNVVVKYDPSDNKEKKSDALARNIPNVKANNLSQNKTKKIEHLQTEDNTKKITLEEYKKRKKIVQPKS